LEGSLTVSKVGELPPQVIARLVNQTYGRKLNAQKENMSTNLMPIKIANYLYMGAAFGYFMYSLITQTGLCGYLMDVQLRWFGVAYNKFTMLIAILILMAPAALIFTYIQRKEVSTPNAANRSVIANFLWNPVSSWKSLLIISLVPTLLTLPIYFALTWMDHKDQQREVYKVDLNDGSALSSGDVKFVHLTGVVQFDYKYRLGRESSAGSSGMTKMYAPLTGSGWTPERPIRFFINTTLSSHFDAQTKRFSSFPERGPVAVTFDGRLTRNGLPTFVENKYRRTGLLIESPYYVLDQMTFVDGRIPSAAEREQYYLIPMFGILVSIGGLVGGSIGLAIRKLRRPGPEIYDHYSDR
jgi:hypothetical protein